MDGNNQPNDGFFSHLLDPHLGQVLNGLVRSLLPHHDQHQQPLAQAPQPTNQAAEQAAPMQPETTRTESNSSTGGDGLIESPSSSSSQPAPVYTTAAPRSDASSHQPYPPSGASEPHDVEMSSSESHSEASASTGSSTERPQLTTHNSRRVRIEEEEEDEDYWRESNRQRIHSPTPHDDQHHYMPIPDDHGVPQASHANVPQPPPYAPPAAPAEAPQPPPGRLTWTFDFLPINANGAQTHTVHHIHHEHLQAGNGQAHDHAHDRHEHQHHDLLPLLNFVINIPPPGGDAQAQPAAAAAHGGGNAPGNAGFAFPPFAFPFGFGMDMLEERDDPGRAQRLVDGLEEVPVGLIQRMERAGGPGTSQGEAPTCAVCWESLLEPEGGGFEGNAELARAEAAQVVRDDAASQQEREGSMDSDTDSETSTSASASEASSSSASGSSHSTAPSTSPGAQKHPKIVVLPCSHVFHASCLLPWFSKPGRTTCPSCRFDIDPDSLTYKPRPLRARPAQPAPAPPAGAEGAPQPQQQQQPHPWGHIRLPPFGPPPPPPAAPNVAPPPAPNAQGVNPGVQPQGPGPEGQPGHQQHQPLPPFITFDISMIIPVFPGRPAGAAPPAPGTQAANGAAGANPQGAAPPPIRTDHHGLRMDDPILAEAVRNTIERMLRGPPPAAARAQPQQPAAAGVDSAAPANNANPPPPVMPPPFDWFTFAGPLPAGFPPMPPLHAARGAPQAPAPKRKWTLPPAPGPTLRQLVERNEREMGLRCSDVSCGLGPSDEDPVTTFDAAAVRQIAIRPLKGEGAVCAHRFHPSCLVSAERVAGWGGEDKKEEREKADAGAGEEGDVEVSCPVCRAVGVISRVDWDEGACALA